MHQSPQVQVTALGDSENNVTHTQAFTYYVQQMLHEGIITYTLGITAYKWHQPVQVQELHASDECMYVCMHASCML